jgi:hypothetical protein
MLMLPLEKLQKTFPGVLANDTWTASRREKFTPLAKRAVKPPENCVFGLPPPRAANLWKASP